MRFPFIFIALTLIAGGISVTGTALASEDEFNLTNGLYAGTVRAPRGPRRPVSLELRGESLIMADVDEVTVGRVNFIRFGEEAKDGRTTFSGTWTLGGAMTIAGKGRRVSRTEAPVALTLWPDGRAVFCHAIGPHGAKDGAIRVPPGAAMPGPKVRCLDLGRTFSSATPPPEVVPPVPSRDWEAVPPVPTRDWERPEEACVAACVADAGKKAVSAAVLTAECRAKCAPKVQHRVFTPERRAP